LGNKIDDTNPQVYNKRGTLKGQFPKNENCHNLLSQVVLNLNKFLSYVENKSYFEECG